MSMIIYLTIIIIIISLLLFENSLAYFFKTYIYENDLEKLLKFENKITLTNFQEIRYKKASKYTILLIFFPLLNFSFYYFFFILILIFQAYKKPYYKLKKIHKENLSLIRYQFPIWLRQIQILLHNNNVLIALKLSSDSAPNIIKNDLLELIENLESDPNNIEVFIDFMSHYKLSEIDRAMKLLYRTYIVDKEESSKQLNRMIISTTKWIRVERKAKQNDSLDIYEWIGIIPLFGVTVVFLVIMASVINNLLVKGVSM